MKKYCLSFFLIIHLGGLAQSVIELDNKNGYKDITFDMPFDSLSQKLPFRKDLYQAPGRNEIRYTIREKKYTSINEIPVEPTFTVYKNKITTITLKVSNWNRYETSTVSMFTALYGEPVKSGAVEKNYVWEGSIVRLSITESYVYKFGLIIIQSTENIEAKKKDEEIEARKKGSDF